MQQLGKSGIAGFLMDLRCLFGTVIAVLRSDGVVEGGTGTMDKENKEKQ